MRSTSPIALLLIVMLAFSELAAFHSPFLPTLAARRTVAEVASTASNAPNFTLAVSPLSQTVRIGEQATYRITINSTNGFSGQVSLQNENFPQELLGQFNPTLVNLTTKIPAMSTLTVDTISVGEESFYEFTVLATSGSISQRVNASLTVLAENTPPTIASYTFLAAILLFTAIIIWYGLRARRLHQQASVETPEQPKPPPV